MASEVCRVNIARLILRENTFQAAFRYLLQGSFFIADIESREGVRRGDRVWQIAFGSGKVQLMPLMSFLRC